MISREIEQKLRSLSRKFRVISITGPRQSGKTTLVRKVFPKKPYLSFENSDVIAASEKDPRGFLYQYRDGAVFDEVQRVPQLFSYLQQLVDETNKPGHFILTGSQNFLLLEKITQSLAGRVAILKLLPLSINELKKQKMDFGAYEDFIFQGFYPEIFDRKIQPQDFFPGYIQTYVERDVRQIKNIPDLRLFSNFLKICAGRTGQLVNLSSLSSDCGITHKTASSWLSVLEASFIIHLVNPYFRNFNKRLVKMPKLYFFDTGLACSLLGIENVSQLSTHYLRGALFENFIFNEFLKTRFNNGKTSNLYFWRDKLGREIDCIVEKSGDPIPIEIKSGKTFNDDFLKDLITWNKLSKRNPKKSYLVYGGDLSFKQKEVTLVGWKELGKLLKQEIA